MLYITKTIQIICIILLNIVQISLIWGLFYPLNNLNIILTFAIFLTVIKNFKHGIFFSFLSGAIIELYSNIIFGPIILSLIITIIIIDILFKNLFTNKSLYSLICLGLLGTIAYNALNGIIRHLLYLINVNNASISLNYTYLYSFSWQLLLNLLALIILFYIFKNRRFVK